MGLAHKASTDGQIWGVVTCNKAFAAIYVRVCACGSQAHLSLDDVLSLQQPKGTAR